MTPNIALTGKFRSGKDSVAAHLVTNHGYTRFAFGDELKRLYHSIFGYSVDGKDRDGYQWFGQKMREREPEIWTQLMFDQIRYSETCFISGRVTPIVISDLRQPNEYSALKSRGYTVVRVTCPDHIRIQRCVAAGDSFDQSTLAHETESHVDGFDVDWEIVNDGTLDELEAAVDAVMAHISEVTV